MGWLEMSEPSVLVRFAIAQQHVVHDPVTRTNEKNRAAMAHGQPTVGSAYVSEVGKALSRRVQAGPAFEPPAVVETLLRLAIHQNCVGRNRSLVGAFLGRAIWHRRAAVAHPGAAVRPKAE